jgi:hypothetical protein
MNWISVKDRLPEEDGRYLAYGFIRFFGSNEFKKDAAIYKVRFIKSKFCTKKWILDPNENVIEVNATHWMPLPEKPE